MVIAILLCPSGSNEIPYLVEDPREWRNETTSLGPCGPSGCVLPWGLRPLGRFIPSLSEWNHIPRALRALWMCPPSGPAAPRGVHSDIPSGPLLGTEFHYCPRDRAVFLYSLSMLFVVKKGGKIQRDSSTIVYPDFALLAKRMRWLASMTTHDNTRHRSKINFSLCWPFQPLKIYIIQISFSSCLVWFLIFVASITADPLASITDYWWPIGPLMAF